MESDHLPIKMAIITVTVADADPTPFGWELPPNPAQIRSPVPRGLIIFAGTVAIPTLVAGNETTYFLTTTMPDGFAYLLKNMEIDYVSSTLENGFDVNGHGFINRSNSPGGSGAGDPGRVRFNIQSPGNINVAAAVAVKIWTPIQGSPKVILRPGEDMQFYVQDMDAAQDGSVSGVMSYNVEMYVFDLDQIDKWEINTPTPVISHVSF